MTTNHNDEFEITGNESLEELEAMLDAAGGDEDFADFDNGAADELTGAETQGTEADDLEGDTPAASPPAESEAQPEGVLAKDGKHVIPMDVLEKERQENARLRQELETALAKNNEASAITSQYEKAQRIIDVRNKQLEELGVAPEDLPEDIKLDDEQLAALKEDYPELANYFVAMNNKIESMAKQQGVTEPARQTQSQQPDQPSQQPASNGMSPELSAAFAGNQDLQTWQKQGDPRWASAQQIDDHLASSPEWKDRPYAERFAEVTKRVRLAYGDPAKPTPQEARAAAERAGEQVKDKLPASPSELGNTNRNENQDLLTRLENSSEAEVSRIFDSMSPAQIEKVLADAGY